MSMAHMLLDPQDQGKGNPVASDHPGRRHPMSAALLQAAAHASAQESSLSPQAGDDHDHSHDNLSEGDGDGDGDGDADGDADHAHEAGADGGEPYAKRKKRSRACQACRGMKIRCLPVEGQEACRACSKVNRACIMPGPARKRQKTVHKVAELEKKIDALTKSLAAKNAAASESTNALDHRERRQSDMSSGPRNVHMNTSATPAESPATASTASSHARHGLAPPPRPERESNFEALEHQAFPELSGEARLKASELASETGNGANYADVITRGIVSIDRAIEIFERWKLELCPYCPFIVFPESVTVQWLRRKRPMVLLAILGVACGTIQPELQVDLMVELARQLADRVMFYHEKSIDLAQALMIFPIWYGKHREAKDLGFNQYIHSSVTMCLDLGLGKRSRKALNISPEQDLERRRLWLGCYYLAGSVTTVLRVPCLVKFSTYVQECLDCLSTHPAGLPTDRWLCCLVRLNHMYEDIGLLFHMDDPGSNIPVNDSRTQFHFKMFSRQLEEWKHSAQHLVPKAVLDQYVSVTSLYIHEIAMHTEHNVDDFRPEILKDNEELAAGARGDAMTNEHFEALTICVDSMESAMTAFGLIDLRILRGLPCLSMVWMAYVAVAMIRLHGVLKAPDSKYGEIFLPKMNIERHLESCIARLNFIVSETSHSPIEAFLTAFKKLRAWFALRNSETNPLAAVQDTNGSAVRSNEQRNYEPTALDTPQSPASNHNPTGMQASRYSSLSHQSQSPPNQALSGFTALNQNVPRLLPHQVYMANQPPRVPVPNHMNQSPTAGINPQPASSLLDPNATIDASTFDIAWDLNGINTNLTELNNFDVYMNDVGWMGYLM